MGIRGALTTAVTNPLACNWIANPTEPTQPKPPQPAQASVLRKQRLGGLVGCCFVSFKFFRPQSERGTPCCLNHFQNNRSTNSKSMWQHTVLTVGALLVQHAEPHDVPAPVWPQEFAADFVETTWFGGNGTEVQQTPGSVVYSWSQRTQVMRRSISRLNPICNEVRPNRSSPCEHFIVNESRYLYWPLSLIHI